MNRVGGPLVSTRGYTAAQRRTLYRKHQAGELEKLFPGVFVNRGALTSYSSHFPNDAELHYQLIVHAAAASQPKGVVAGRSAACLRGLARPSSSYKFSHPGSIDIGFDYDSQAFTRHTADPKIHRRRLSKDVMNRTELLPTVFGELCVTSLEDTCMQLAQWYSVEEGCVAAESALRHLPAETYATTFGAHLVRRKYGAQSARQVLNLITPWSESPMESEIKVRMWEAGLPAPYQQATIHRPSGRFVGRVDFLFACGVVVEYDGREKYLNGAFGRDTYRAEVEMAKELSRHKAIASLGYEIVRIDRDSYRQGRRDGAWLDDISDRVTWMSTHPGKIKDPQWLAKGKAWREKGDLGWLG